MNPEHNESVSTKSINEVELEAATNATFDGWTQGARDFYKGACKLVENLDDHANLLMTDIFGSKIGQEHSRKLEEEARSEANAGHLQAANHFKRRDLNFSRSTLGENDNYTLNLTLDLRSEQEVERDENYLKLISVSHPTQRCDELLKEKFHL
jgi:hypothetical protein